MANYDGLKQPEGFTGQDFGPPRADSRVNDFLARGKAYGDPALASQQAQLLSLSQQANGLGTSLAQTQLQSQANRNVSDAFAMAAMGRGGNQAGMQQAGLGSLTATQADTNNQAVMARLAEQQGAQQMLAASSQQMAQNQLSYEQMAQSALLGSRELDQQWSIDKGYLDLEKKKYQTDRNLAWAGLGKDVLGSLFQGISQLPSDERVKDIASRSGDPRVDARRQEVDRGVADAQRWRGVGGGRGFTVVEPFSDADYAQPQQAPQEQQGMIDDIQGSDQWGAGQRFGYGLGKGLQSEGRDYFDPGYHRLSDERMKDPAGSSPTPASDAVRPVESASFQYKPEAVSAGVAAPGTHVGVIAQQVERTPLAGMIRQGPGGVKMVDGAEAGTTALAAAAESVRRLDRIEAMLSAGERPLDGGRQLAQPTMADRMRQKYAEASASGSRVFRPHTGSDPRVRQVLSPSYSDPRAEMRMQQDQLRQGPTPTRGYQPATLDVQQRDPSISVAAYSPTGQREASQRTVRRKGQKQGMGASVGQGRAAQLASTGDARGVPQSGSQGDVAKAYRDQAGRIRQPNYEAWDRGESVDPIDMPPQAEYPVPPAPGGRYPLPAGAEGASQQMQQMWDQFWESREAVTGDPQDIWQATSPAYTGPRSIEARLREQNARVGALQDTARAEATVDMTPEEALAAADLEDRNAAVRKSPVMRSDKPEPASPKQERALRKQGERSAKSKGYKNFLEYEDAMRAVESIRGTQREVERTFPTAAKRPETV